LLRVHVDQYRTLVDEYVSVEETTRATNFPAIDLNVVTWTKLRVDTKFAQARCGCVAYFSGQIRQCRDTERLTVKDELPTQLAFIKVNRTTAGDAPDNTDASIPAVVEIDLLAQILMSPD